MVHLAVRKFPDAYQRVRNSIFSENSAYARNEWLEGKEIHPDSIMVPTMDNFFTKLSSSDFRSYIEN